MSKNMMWTQFKIKEQKKGKKKTLLTRDTTKRCTCCLHQDQLRETKIPSNRRLLSVRRNIFWILQIHLATRPRFLNTWRAATVALGNFSLLMFGDCRNAAAVVTVSGPGEHRVASHQAVMNRTLSPGHGDASLEDSRILFVEDYDTLFPSDYSACQVLIKGRALGCSATLCNRHGLFIWYYIILFGSCWHIQIIWYKGAFQSIFCCPFLILQCRDVWKQSGYLASGFASALVQPTDLCWAFSYICMTSTFSRQACIAGFRAWRLFVDPPFTFSLPFLLPPGP